MTDPYTWANTPGMGRAPLLPTPQPAADPASQLAALLMQGSGRSYVPEAGGPMDPRERPTAFAPDPAGLSDPTLAGFHEGYGGWSGPTGMGRVPGMVVGGATMIPGAGAVAGAMGNRGAQQYHGQLQDERTQRMAQAMERGRQESGTHQGSLSRANAATSIADAYEAGRQAAGGGGGSRDQARDRSDISRSSRGGGGSQTRDNYAI